MDAICHNMSDPADKYTAFRCRSDRQRDAPSCSNPSKKSCPRQPPPTILITLFMADAPVELLAVVVIVGMIFEWGGSKKQAAPPPHIYGFCEKMNHFLMGAMCKNPHQSGINIRIIEGWCVLGGFQIA
jgi:hypothetical protein